MDRQSIQGCSRPLQVSPLPPVIFCNLITQRLSTLRTIKIFSRGINCLCRPHQMSCLPMLKNLIFSGLWSEFSFSQGVCRPKLTSQTCSHQGLFEDTQNFPFSPFFCHFQAVPPGEGQELGLTVRRCIFLMPYGAFCRLQILIFLNHRNNNSLRHHFIIIIVVVVFIIIIIIIVIIIIIIIVINSLFEFG